MYLSFNQIENFLNSCYIKYLSLLQDMIKGQLCCILLFSVHKLSWANTFTDFKKSTVRQGRQKLPLMCILVSTVLSLYIHIYLLLFTGMTCMSCVRKIEGQLIQKPAIKFIQVSLDERLARIKYNAGKRTLKDTIR